jgi:hypothetical protein
VSEKLLQFQDEVTTRTAAAPVPWSHAKWERREAQASKKKAKKLAWLQAMYGRGRAQMEEGRAQMRAEGAADGVRGGRHGGEARGCEGEEGEVDDLLQWSDALDFESYHQDWLGLATSARPAWPAGAPIHAVRGIG